MKLLELRVTGLVLPASLCRSDFLSRRCRAILPGSVTSGKLNPTFVTIAAIAVAALGALGAMNSYQVSAAYSAQYPDAYGGERAQTRFASLNERIPASAELGYFTDLDSSQPAFAPAFLAAQYAVAPRVLLIMDGRVQPEWAVGNFSQPQDFAAAGQARGYSMVADLGNGVILFRRKGS